MKRRKLISFLMAFVGLMMVSVGFLFMEDEKKLYKVVDSEVAKMDLKEMLTSADMIFEEEEEEPEKLVLKEEELEIAPVAVVIPPRIEVYEGMTMEELAAQLDKTLKNDLAGKGYVIASKSIEYGVDPIVVTAIMMHETGCAQRQCSNIARNCYNYGGQKGKGCGAYKRYDSPDEGIEGMISNLYRNYYAIGLDTVEKIAPKYCEGNTWAGKINWYVNKIRNA